MSALGLMAITFGGLLLWAGLTRTNAFDVLRSIIGVASPARTSTGAAKTPATAGA